VPVVVANSDGHYADRWGQRDALHELARACFGRPEAARLAETLANRCDIVGGSGESCLVSESAGKVRAGRAAPGATTAPATEL